MPGEAKEYVAMLSRYDIVKDIQPIVQSPKRYDSTKSLYQLSQSSLRGWAAVSFEVHDRKQGRFSDTSKVGQEASLISNMSISQSRIVHDLGEEVLGVGQSTRG
mmetsp:Transcript_4249/g.8278  ORF Transcript_4249/g.8278 Transcript_4249/m.8278 type:complete len:104 (-) Transcript_4249:4029-4340(-)